MISKIAVTPHLRGLYVLLAFFVCNITAVSGQTVTKPTNAAASQQPLFEVTQLSAAAWNMVDGLPYKQVPGVNLGATSFQVLNANHIAYLCNSSAEIIVTDAKNGKAISKFSAGIAPRDFTYDNGKYFVLNDFSVGVYDASGKLTNTIEYSKQYLGVVRLTRYNNATYLLLPNGNSLQIESNGAPITGTETKGIITSTGKRVLTQMTSDNSYTVTVITTDSNKTQSTFTTEKKVAGVFVVGATNDRVIVDVQCYTSENPVGVERKIQSISFTQTGIGNAVAEIKVPQMYYVLASKEFYVSTSGILYHMITSPSGVFVFTLAEAEAGTKPVTVYPQAITAQTYHFNEHLINPEEK